MQIMKKEKRETPERIELPNEKSIEHLQERKITNTNEFWRRTLSNRDESKSKKRISEE